MLRAMTLGQAVFASVALASHIYPATAIGVSEPDRAYEFSVCSGGGGAQGVDFRSHFSVYGAEHGIKGWVGARAAPLPKAVLQVHATLRVRRQPSVLAVGAQRLQQLCLRRVLGRVETRGGSGQDHVSSGPL